MIDFALTAEQQELVDSVRRFSRRRLAPAYAQREAEGAFHRPTVAQMGSLGFLGVDLPESFGGLGLDGVTSGLVTEALCAGDMNVGYLSVNISLCGQILCRYGRPDVVEPWVREMIAGTAIPSIAITEPTTGSDAGDLVLSARRDGEEYVLNGEKTSISMAGQSDFSLVFARTGSKESRARGISVFLVPLRGSNVTTTPIRDHGNRSIGRGSMFFDDVRVPASHLVGEEGQGFTAVMQGFDHSRALLALQCLAVARVSIDETWQHVTQREAFGKALSTFQGVTFPLAEADTMVTAARLLCLHTLWLRDQGLPHTTESAMAKWWAPKLAYDAVNTCLLLHGHAGYSQDLPYEQRMRDLLGLQIGEGTSQIMKLVVARQRAGRGLVPN